MKNTIISSRTIFNNDVLSLEGVADNTSEAWELVKEQGFNFVTRGSVEVFGLTREAVAPFVDEDDAEDFPEFLVLDDGKNIIIHGNTYPIKSDLKAVGFRWGGYTPVPHFKASKKVLEMNRPLLKILPASIQQGISSIIDGEEKQEVQVEVKEGEIKLYNHQKEGVQFIANRQFSLLNWSMGSGKTFVPIAYAASTGARLFAIVPALTRLNFYKEAENYGLEAAFYPVMPQMRKAYRARFSDDWVNRQVAVTSYATFNIHTKKTPEAFEEIAELFDVLVLDESQYIKNYKAQRTKAVLKLISLFRKAGKKVVFLSGTPLMSRPVELYTTLKAVNPDLENFAQFAIRYNGAQYGRYGLELGRATRTEELFQRMSYFTSRVRKEDCLDLPQKIRMSVDLNGKAKVKAPKAKEYDHHLAYLGAYKKAVADAKVNATVDYVADLIEMGEAVVVFSWYTETNDAIAAGLRKKGYRVAQIHSEMGLTSNEKEAIVADFQAGKYDAVVGGIKIMGVGLTLTRARHVVFNDLSWVPSDLMQAEDRIHRIGQESKTQSHYMVAQDDFDQALWGLIQKKFRDVTAVMDGVVPEDFADKSVYDEMRKRFWKK